MLISAPVVRGSHQIDYVTENAINCSVLFIFLFISDIMMREQRPVVARKYIGEPSKSHNFLKNLKLLSDFGQNCGRNPIWSMSNYTAERQGAGPLEGSHLQRRATVWTCLSCCVALMS